MHSFFRGIPKLYNIVLKTFRESGESNPLTFVENLYPPFIIMMLLYTHFTVAALSFNRLDFNEVIITLPLLLVLIVPYTLNRNIFIYILLITCLCLDRLTKQVFGGHEILIMLAWLPLLLLPYQISKKRIFFYIPLGILFIDALTTLGHITTMKELFVPYTIVASLESNGDEARQFFTTTSNYTQLLVIPIVLIFIANLKKIPRNDTVKIDVYKIAFTAFVSIFLMVLLYGRYGSVLPRNVTAILNFSTDRNLFKSFEKREILNLDVSVSKKAEAENIFVLIIGESCNRNHLSLYGYNRETSPNLKNRKDIAIYKNVVSPYAVTVKSVLSMLTEANLENKMVYQESVSLFDIFHSAKHQTFWLSTQQRKGIYNHAVYNLSASADSVIFYESDEAKENVVFDDVLFHPLQEILNSSDEDKFIVLHLSGSHYDYSKRYPGSYAAFDDQLNAVARTIDEYDNSILFNDFVVDSIFNILDTYSRKNTKAIVSSIYLSDHGENVYDDEGTVGHSERSLYYKSTVEIPFIVWLSEKYKEAYPSKASTIFSSENTPFVSDDVFHSVMDLNNINWKNFDSSRSVFNENFNPNRKRVLGDNFDYDTRVQNTINP